MTAENFEELLSLVSINIQKPQSYVSIVKTSDNFFTIVKSFFFAKKVRKNNQHGVRGDNTRVAVIAMEYGCTVPGQPGSGTLPMGFSQL
ncbi:hypothetical protein SFRURICE_009958 [Spodoptera frugiperda]|nr:hypothetical protein SFRURICE_009958 [Spodoptera frugiperda]